jgi:hypothetical protein
VLRKTLELDYVILESRVIGLLQNLIVAQVVKKCPAFYGTITFITVHKIPPPVSILSHMNLVLVYFLNTNFNITSHLLLDLPSSLFHSGFNLRKMYTGTKK